MVLTVTVVAAVNYCSCCFCFCLCYRCCWCYRRFSGRTVCLPQADWVFVSSSPAVIVLAFCSRPVERNKHRRGPFIDKNIENAFNSFLSSSACFPTNLNTWKTRLVGDVISLAIFVIVLFHQSGRLFCKVSMCVSISTVAMVWVSLFTNAKHSLCCCLLFLSNA